VQARSAARHRRDCAGVGEVLNTHNMKKHFDLSITDDAFSYARKHAEITAG
jgi:hypothetical protein